MLCCQNADIDSVLVFTIQNGSRTFFFKLLFAWIWGPKNHPKTSQKPCPGDPKIDLENVLFFNIDFFAFWPRFWSLLGLQGGAELLVLDSKSGLGVVWVWLSSLPKLSVLKKWRLGGLWPRFGRPQGLILEPPSLDFNDIFSDHKLDVF